jgi:hypothetical protein
LFALSSCTEKIDLKLKTSEARLVVEGGIGIDTTVHTVILSTTMAYFTTSADIPYVSNATVTITEFDENMQQTQIFLLKENSSKKGHYETASNVFGKQRYTYRLNISNVNIGGQTNYTADAYFPPIADKIDSIRAVWGQNLLFLLLMGIEPNPNSIRTGWNIEVFANDTDEENYYFMVIYKNGIPLNDTLTRLLFIPNYKEFIDSTLGLAGIPVAFVSDSSYAAVKEGDILGLEIRAVSQDYARYIDEFTEVYGGSSPMFGGVPANVRGNVSGGAIGYFWAHGSRKAFDVANKSKRPTWSFTP